MHPSAPTHQGLRIVARRTAARSVKQYTAGDEMLWHRTKAALRLLWRLVQVSVVLGTLPWLWWLWLPALFIDWLVSAIDRRPPQPPKTPTAAAELADG
jgi:hypothetical protein